MKKSGKVKKIVLGGAAIAALLGHAHALEPDERAQAHPSEVILSVHEEESSQAYSVGIIEEETKSRWLAAFALSGLLAGFVRLVGMNKILQWVGSLSDRLGKTAKKAAKATGKAAGQAAKTVADASSKIAQKPLKLALMIGGLALFVFTGISVLDIEWQAGLAVGAASVATFSYGVQKTGKAFKNVMKKFPFKGKVKDSVSA